MWFSRVSKGFRGWFVVVDSLGELVSGLASGGFSVTVVTPDDLASTTATVTESAQKPGMYLFDVPTSFLIDQGPGNYGVVVEVSSGLNQDVFSQVLAVSQADFDSLQNLGNAILGNVV